MAKARKQIKNGSYLGACKIVRLLGRGSIGETYEAQDVVLNRHAVVKVVSPFITEKKEAIKRFTATGQALARINHQNVATVYSLKEIDSVHFITMEFVEGRSLKDLIKDEGRINSALAVKIFGQVLEGVKCLHDAGIIHQDLKPKNIIIRPDNFVKVVDFGIGRIDGEEVVGTIYYWAPEVIDGGRGSIESDIWSLGVTLFEALTGEKPFLSEDWREVVQKIHDEKITFPENLEIPEALKYIILRMCEKSSLLRYASIGEILQDLRNSESLRAVTLPTALQTTIQTTTQTTTQRSEPSLSHSLEPTSPSLRAGTNTWTATTTTTQVRKSSGGVFKYVAGALLLGCVIWFYRYQDASSKSASGSGPAPLTKPDTPTEGQVVVLTGSEAVKFTWSQPARGGVYLEVARDREFREILFREAYRNSPYTPNKPLKEGKYFWRLMDKSATAGRTLVEPTGFTVVSDKAPKPMYPANAFVVLDAKPTQFFWLNKFGVDNYRFQISAEKSFEHLFSDVVVDGIQTDPVILPAGEFFWRVRAEDKHSVTSAWSEVRSLQTTAPLAKDIGPREEHKSERPSERAIASVAPVVTPPPTPTPVLKPKFKKEAPVKVTKVDRPVKKPPEKQPAKVVAKPKPPARTAKKTSAPAFEFVEAPVAKRHVASAEKSAGVPGPLLKMPPDGVSIVSLNGSQDPVSFRWESKGEGAVYRLQLALDSGFSQLVLNVLARENQFVVTKSLPQGRIFWRVRSDDGTKSDWSTPSSFDVSK